MNVIYNDKTNLPCIRLNDKKQGIINKRISEDIVLDIGKNEKFIGIEVFSASRNTNLERFLPIRYEVPKKAV